MERINFHYTMPSEILSMFSPTSQTNLVDLVPLGVFAISNWRGASTVGTHVFLNICRILLHTYRITISARTHWDILSADQAPNP